MASEPMAAPASLAEPTPPSDDALLHAETASGRLEALDAESLLRWAIDRYHPDLVLSCSFAAPAGLVILDLTHRIEPAAGVFMLDTGRLPQATADLVDRVRDRDGIEVEVVFPDPRAIQEMVRRH